jgi:chromosome partitioning protein
MVVRVWSVLGQKGGTGKTTLVLHLAIAAMAKGFVTSVIDLDPQRSAEQWSDLREKKAGAQEPPIVHGTSSSLGEMLTAARATGSELVLVDTPPLIDKTLIFAAEAADLIIVPSRVSILDHLALTETVRVLEAMQALRKAVVVFNAVGSDKQAKAELAKIVKAASRDFDVPILSVTLEDRGDFSHSLSLGKGVTESAPRGAAARELQTLFRLLCQWERKVAQQRKRVPA